MVDVRTAEQFNKLHDELLQVIVSCQCAQRGSQLFSARALEDFSLDSFHVSKGGNVLAIRALFQNG